MWTKKLERVWKCQKNAEIAKKCQPPNFKFFFSFLVSFDVNFVKMRLYIAGIAKSVSAAECGRNCRNPGLNQGPLDLQSNALPTELFRPTGNSRLITWLTTADVAAFPAAHNDRLLLVVLYAWLNKPAMENDTEQQSHLSWSNESLSRNTWKGLHRCGPAPNNEVGICIYSWEAERHCK